MSMSVKGLGACGMVRAIADNTAETLTKVVMGSLRERQEQVEKKRTKVTVEEMIEIAQRAY